MFCTCFGSFPWAAAGSMDKKLIIWDLQHSSARSTCDHEVTFQILCNVELNLLKILLSGVLTRGHRFPSGWSYLPDVARDI